MSKGMNKCFLLGNVGRDPEVKVTSGGTTVANLSLATPDRVKRNDEWVEETIWHNIVAFGKTADVIQKYVKKGSQLLIEGKIVNRSWDDKESGEKRYRSEVIVNDLTLLGGKGEGEDGGSRRERKSSSTTKAEPHGQFDPNEFDGDEAASIPF